jgi:hypothetical protein
MQWRGHLKALSLLRLSPELCSMLASKVAQLVESECEAETEGAEGAGGRYLTHSTCTHTHTHAHTHTHTH